MDGLDRLGWAAGVAFEAHGVRVGVRVTDAASMDLVRAALPPDWRPGRGARVDHLFSLVVGGSVSPRGSVRRLHVLYGGSERLARDRHQAPVLEALETELRRTVAEFAPARVFVHAGVVGWRGRAIVLPGRTFTGKSTLVAELVRAGATYYSDEYAPIDGRGRVHPFAKPLSLREGFGRGAEVPPEALGGPTGDHPIPIGAIVLARYERGRTWRPRRRSAGEGALALVSNAIAARNDPGRTMAAVGRATHGALVLNGTRGEAGEAARAILRVAGASSGDTMARVDRRRAG
jgi:hypothetical protein